MQISSKILQQNHSFLALKAASKGSLGIGSGCFLDCSLWSYCVQVQLEANSDTLERLHIISGLWTPSLRNSWRRWLGRGTCCHHDQGPDKQGWMDGCMDAYMEGWMEQPFCTKASAGRFRMLFIVFLWLWGTAETKWIDKAKKWFWLILVHLFTLVMLYSFYLQ